MEITLKSGHKVLIDDEDENLLKQYHWCVHHGYAVANGVRNGKRYSIYMHRLIMNTPEGMEVDHKNGNRLDNRKSNMRNCTTKENCYNRGKNRNNKTGFKCVFRTEDSKKFKARVKFNGKNINLGNYDTASEAAKAYNDWAIKHHGEFAFLNKV